MNSQNTNTKNIEKIAGFTCLTLPTIVDKPITCVYCCDMLSHAMGSAPQGCAWVTVLANINTIAVATLADVSCIIFAGGITPPPVCIEKANEEGIAIFISKNAAFECAKAVDELL